MKAATVGSSLEAIHRKTVEMIKAGLLKLGLITDAAGDQYKMWYTHGSTHYIGLDVHDVGDRRAPGARGKRVRAKRPRRSQFRLATLERPSGAQPGRT